MMWPEKVILESAKLRSELKGATQLEHPPKVILE